MDETRLQNEDLMRLAQIKEKHNFNIPKQQDRLLSPVERQKETYLQKIKGQRDTGCNIASDVVGVQIQENQGDVDNQLFEFYSDNLMESDEDLQGGSSVIQALTNPFAKAQAFVAGVLNPSNQPEETQKNTTK